MVLKNRQKLEFFWLWVVLEVAGTEDLWYSSPSAINAGQVRLFCSGPVVWTGNRRLECGPWGTGGCRYEQAGMKKEVFLVVWDLARRGGKGSVK